MPAQNRTWSPKQTNVPSLQWPPGGSVIFPPPQNRAAVSQREGERCHEVPGSPRAVAILMFLEEVPPLTHWRHLSPHSRWHLLAFLGLPNQEYRSGWGERREKIKRKDTAFRSWYGMPEEKLLCGEGQKRAEGPVSPAHSRACRMPTSCTPAVHCVCHAGPSESQSGFPR